MRHLDQHHLTNREPYFLLPRITNIYFFSPRHYDVVRINCVCGVIPTLLYQNSSLFPYFTNSFRRRYFLTVIRYLHYNKKRIQFSGSFAPVISSFFNRQMHIMRAVSACNQFSVAKEFYERRHRLWKMISFRFQISLELLKRNIKKFSDVTRSCTPCIVGLNAITWPELSPARVLVNRQTWLVIPSAMLARQSCVSGWLRGQYETTHFVKVQPNYQTSDGSRYQRITFCEKWTIDVTEISNYSQIGARRFISRMYAEIL